VEDVAVAVDTTAVVDATGVVVTIAVVLLLRPADGKKINIHTAEEGAMRNARAYGIAAGSVPTPADLETRKPGPRKAIRTGLAVCDSAIHDLSNENRFDINLDSTPTPHRVDKKNRCIWMYEGTQEQLIVPLEYDRDALYVDYRPRATGHCSRTSSRNSSRPALFNHGTGHSTALR
jgi:hypothetical protein